MARSVRRRLECAPLDEPLPGLKTTLESADLVFGISGVFDWNDIVWMAETRGV